jgi:hypothetical protein
MKHTLNAFAVAAGIVAALPAWAQTTTTSPSAVPNTSGPIVRPQTAPMTAPGTYTQTAPGAYPQAGSGTYSRTAPAGTAAMPPTGTSVEPAMGASTEAATDEAMPKRHSTRRHRVHHVTSRTTGRRSKAASDNMADQLNRQEAARAGSGATAEPGGMMPPPQGTMGTGTMRSMPPSGAPSAPPPPR